MQENPEVRMRIQVITQQKGCRGLGGGEDGESGSEGGWARQGGLSGARMCFCSPAWPRVSQMSPVQGRSEPVCWSYVL